jgi:hypothetical protein
VINLHKVQTQLKGLQVNVTGWGRSEYNELCNILGPNEIIEACVNGYYEAGFALLVATKNRLLVVDKKPFNYLTVEDMRFDMINEFDYQHRLFGAQIKISAGNKLLHFTSLNQVRLRRVLSYVQTRMIEIKQEQQEWQENQQRHLAQMNKQLEAFLQLQQLQQQQAWQRLHGGASDYTPADSAIQAFQGQSPGPVPSPATRAVSSSSFRILTPAQLGLAAMKRVVPVISAYTRLSLLSQRRRYGNPSGAR